MIIALQTLVFFRETILTAFGRAIQPFYKKFLLTFSSRRDELEEEELEEQVFSEFDDEKGVIFLPPMYAQRYAAVSDCLMDERWRSKLEKVVEFGYHDISFIKCLKELPGIKRILGVDLESMFLRCSSDLFNCDEYVNKKREKPVQVTLYQGNAADPDYRLIGCDAVIAIEMIEHMLPHDLDRLVHTVFGFIKPWIVIFTTPNGDFNVLFKSLEKNGFRRLDHFFEWSREQFNDWCSNIVVRYPLYTVVCQGVGPGPPGTIHLGCCSQLALFINKDYHKQQDLTLNSLALVSSAPASKPINDLVDGWETSPNTEIFTQTTYGEACSLPAIESFTDLLLCEESSMTLVACTAVSDTIIPPYMPTSEEIPDSKFYVEEEYINRSDKMLQCNLDKERGRNFLMFDENLCLDIRVPRRQKKNKVYEIEDVASRLNCSTYQLKKFSKTTQNLLARNKVDKLVHTREVMDEICHLSKTLNLNKTSDGVRTDDGKSIWSNINWGDNAPYWNQFYKTVVEYNYPYEAKTVECRILDLLTDEINHMIDLHYKMMPTDVKHLKIPISHLMSVVEHITDDTDMVKDLLEWNGYEIIDDVLIHSQSVIDSASAATHDEDSQDIEMNLSEWDNITEVRSTLSEGSTVAPDHYDRCLRRAIDQKVRNLRAMLTADEDITLELDNVMCRLRKLALRASMNRTTPPTLKWMQNKLLDLLTLAEKAVEYRKKHLIENSWKAIELGDNSLKITSLVQDNITANEIEKKYQYIISPTENSASNLPAVEDLMSITSAEFFKELDYIDTDSPVTPATCGTNEEFEPVDLSRKKELNSIEKAEAWLNVDVEIVPPCKQEVNYINISSEDTDSMCNVKHKQKRSKYQMAKEKEIEAAKSLTKKTSSSKHKSIRDDKRRQASSTRITKVSRSNAKISGHYNNTKCGNNRFPLTNYASCLLRSKKIFNKESRCLTMRATKPIPESLIDLCHPELKTEKCIKDFNILSDVADANEIVISNQNSPIGSIEFNAVMDLIKNNTETEETTAVDIQADDMRELAKALHRSLGTDTEVNNADIYNRDTMEMSNVDIDINLCTKHEVSKENICSQTIFLNDINEPSTSKGIRHSVSTDVQCGPDTLAYPMLSTSTSLARMPPVYTGIQIHDGGAATKVQAKDFGTTMQDIDNDVVITPRSRSVGIKIKDSDVNICAANEIYITSQNLAKSQNQCSDSRCYSPCPVSLSPVPRSWSPESSGLIPENLNLFNTTTTDSSVETKLLKPVSSTLKTENSVSEICTSICSSQKYQPFEDSQNFSKNTSEIPLYKPFKHKQAVMKRFSSGKCNKPQLSCGGIDVHSYKDKQESLDIVYQGEWQQYRPKVIRKKAYNTNLGKKINDSVNRKQKDIKNIKEKGVNSKEKLSQKNIRRKEIKADIKNPLKAHINSSKFKEIKSALPKMIKDGSAKTPLRPSVNVSKVSSKMKMGPISQKNVKSAFTATKPLIATVKKEDNPKKVRRSYIPKYILKRRKQNTDVEKSKLNNYSAHDINKKVMLNNSSSLVSSITEDLKKDLISFHENITNNTIMVFHNKQENCSSSGKVLSNENSAKQDNCYINRAHSPQSLNSSTCSSLNSIATVRAVPAKSKKISNKRHLASSQKSSLNNSESENTTPTKTKKCLKRCKSTRKSDSNKDLNNKENIPADAENYANREIDKLFMSPFAGKQSVCIAQLKTDRSSMTRSLSKHKIVKIPNAENSVERKRSLSMSPIRTRSTKCEISSLSNMQHTNIDLSLKSSEYTNMIMETKTQEPTSFLSDSEKTLPTGSGIDTDESGLLSEWLQNLQYESQTSSCINYMRHLVEDLIDTIDCDGAQGSRSMTVNQNSILNSLIDMNDSACSFKTVRVADTLDNIFTESDIENSFNRTFNTALGDESFISLSETVTDLDLLSSQATASFLRPGYFLTDSDLNTAISVIEDAQKPDIVINPTSVTDIFERKQPHFTQKLPGFLANQAFSGFSLDGELLSGDQPDPIAPIDSETGSLAMGVERLATSEELFISGRSTESYESCRLNEDDVVPNWLFHMISQQQSQVAENQTVIGPQPQNMMVETRYDVNGNAVDPGIVAVDAGAGDGRGIHSDQSQDSSGAGTSLSSSSGTSSDEISNNVSQNEEGMIETLGLTGQYDLVRNSVASSDLATIEIRAGIAMEEPHSNTQDNESHPVSSHSRRRPRTQFNVVNDIDADISSIDTDVLDSSDNN